LLHWKLNKHLNEKQIISFEMKINSMKELKGIEFRLYENQSSTKYITYALPLFTDPEFNWVQKEQWNKVTFAASHFKNHLGLKKFKKLGMFLHFNQKSNQKFEFRNFKIIKKPKFNNGLISITFDDGYESILLADDLLKKNNNLMATTYMIKSALGKKGYVTHKQMCQLSQKRWALSSHATIPFTKKEKLEQFINDDILWLSQQCKKRSYPDHLAYPLGKQNKKILDIVSKKYKTARIAGGGVETIPPAQMFRLRAYNVLPSISPKVLIAKAKKAVEEGDWIIFMFHRIEKKRPIKIDLNYNYDDFDEFLKGITHLKKHVKTVPQAYKLL
jgi:peptidoglycan/xylan/chitin deacetylase (PgdA/CDA1 family)